MPRYMHLGLLLAAEQILSCTTNAPLIGKLLANHALLVKRTSNLLCCSANGTFAGELLADAASRVEGGGRTWEVVCVAGLCWTTRS